VRIENRHFIVGDDGHAIILLMLVTSPFIVERARRDPQELSPANGAFSSALAYRFRPTFNMLRHACGFGLASAGQDAAPLVWSGHLQHTVRYTELTPHRFKWF
jgi:hypothetical protein